MAKLTKGKLLQPLLLLIFFALFFCLSGCGGSPATTATTGATTTTTTTTPTTPTTTNLSSLTLSTASNSVIFGTPLSATATLKDANGALLPGAVVTFVAADSSLVVFTPATTALTNASGVASVNLNAATYSSAGATSITVSAPVTTAGTTTTVTSTPVGISVGTAAITLGALFVAQSPISAYGSSIVSIPVYINSVLATIPISVAFTSPCVGEDLATLTSPVTTILGTATSTYKDNGCASGTDTITASVTGATASATITVAIPATNNIQFVSVTPAIIGIQGSGASTLPESSIVKFQVVDSNNNGKAGVLVDFSLLPANYVLLGITMSAASATSDANGYVTTTVTSGTVPTPVWVVAKVHSNPAILTQSNTLTITTGLPTQNFFSLSVQTHNVEGWEYDGVTSTLTIIASDRLGNPVPDGTVINFITAGAQIRPASCTTAKGTCTVTFITADFRPNNITPGIAALDELGNPITIDGGAPLFVTKGRVTLLAYAVGEKSFIDANFNNIYDPGETFYDLGDLYIDENENGIWDPGETYIPYDNPAGTLACTTQPSLAPLPANYATSPSKEMTCTGVWGEAYVRRDQIMTLSSIHPVISQHTFTMGASCYQTFSFWLMDENYNPMPAGTTVSIANNHVTYSPTVIPIVAAVSVLGQPVYDSNHAGGTRVSLTVDGASAADGCGSGPFPYPTGLVDIVITTPAPGVLATNITVLVN
ncbi:MAG: Ig-like domain-containing protein [Smithellaceae bacterium]